MSIAGKGVWEVHSNINPKWNKSGHGFGSTTNGGPQELKDWIKECKEKYGEPPKDATMSFMKD